MKRCITDYNWIIWYALFMLMYSIFAIVSFIVKEYALAGLGAVFFVMTLADLCIKIKKFKDLKKPNNNEENT
jgi:hypothetical protein